MGPPDPVLGSVSPAANQSACRGVDWQAPFASSRHSHQVMRVAKCHEVPGDVQDVALGLVRLGLEPHPDRFGDWQGGSIVDFNPMVGDLAVPRFSLGQKLYDLLFERTIG